MGLLSVIVDSREPAWVQQLQFDGASVAVAMLDAGDLLCACDDGNLLAIERKSSSDFLNTLRDERLFPQIAKLREVTPWAYLVITGTLHPGNGGRCITEERESGWNWASVAGALTTVQELGVCVVQAASDLDYGQTIIRLANRDRSGLHIAPARDITIMAEGEQILAALPGIGATKARTLLATYGTPWLALHYLTVWDKYWTQNPVAGIGDGTKRRIRKALAIADGFYIGSQQFPIEESKDK